MDLSTEKPKIQIELPQKSEVTTGFGAWPLRLDHVSNWAWKEQLFTSSELDAIINIGNAVDLDKAQVFGQIQSDDLRNSKVRFLFPNSYTNWIFGRLTQALVEINEQFFQFDLSGFEQGLQFTKYSAPCEHYHWHIDRGHLTPTRKLSVSVQLNDPNEYEGGELELKFGHENETIEQKKAMAVFFPSYTLHRVKPVTQGTRYSLVAWISGPPFK